MIRARVITVLLAALLAGLVSSATLSANDGSDGGEQPAAAAPSVADADCLTWRVSYTNAPVGRSGAVDFEAYGAAQAFRDSLCDQTSYPIFENVRGPACLRVYVREDHAAYTRPDGRQVAPQWSVRIAPWDPERFGGSGGNVFALWQGFQGRDAERFARALAQRIAEDFRSLGYTVADPGDGSLRSGRPAELGPLPSPPARQRAASLRGWPVLI